MQDWLNLTAAALGRGIADGSIDPVQLTETFLTAARAHPDSARIYARLTPDRALAEAQAAAARARAKTRLSPLDGVPLSWKDLFDTAGTATESGSRLLAGRTPKVDADVLARATLQGTVCLGKTHMTELAFSGLGLNPMTATPPNAIDAPRAPGGSSSGAAVSVALNLAPAAIGSDTGGSVRIPAAWNGLVGLKTTHGRLPLTGVVPLIASFDTVGPLTRTVEDAALLFAILNGSKSADLRGATLRGTRFLIAEDTPFDDIRPEPLAAFDDAVRRLTDAGATVTRGALPQAAAAIALSGPLFTAEAWATWGTAIEARPNDVYAPIRDRFRLGRDFTATDTLTAWDRLRALRAAWAAATAPYDAVLMPTSPILPPDAARLLADPAFFASENLLALRNTRIGNLMGLCALTLPTATPMCGLSLLAAPGHDERLLRLGAAAEPLLRA
jgi:aspartyl-tRNA(Asn)/glutamyl-tRNA(Gln) amidotransferase subunit A